jgi:hypothetical protein
VSTAAVVIAILLGVGFAGFCLWLAECADLTDREGR